MRTPTPNGEKFDTTQRWCPHCSGDSKLQGHCNHADVITIECPEPGAIIASDYEYISLLGSGGMGVVYKCRNIHLDKMVAVKMLIARRYDQEDVVRFQKEARAAGKFKHPNLISVLDFGIANDTAPFMVMEYLEGSTLDRLIDEGDATRSELLSIFSECASGLAYAHQQGVLHRDLKPANIMVVDLGGNTTVKILDFGIAKIADAGRFEHTSSGKGFFGTPSYMSPEQSLGDVLTDRCDVYSMGCVMYEAFTGQRPFEAGSAIELITLHQTAVPALIGECVPEQSFPENLEVLISSMLLKNPKLRPSMKEVADELVRILEDERVKALKAEAVADGLSQSDPLPSKNQETIAKLALAGIGLLVLIFVFGPFKNLSSENKDKPLPYRDEKEFLSAFSKDAAVLGDNRAKYQTDQQLLKSEMSFDMIEVEPEQLKLIAKKGVNCHSLRFINCTGLTAKNIELLRPMNLAKIVIRGDDLTNEGLEVLSTFGSLTSVALEETPNIDSAGIAKLKRAPKLNSLAIRRMRFDEQSIKLCSEMKLDGFELSEIHDFDETALASLTKSSIGDLQLIDLDVTDTGFEIVSRIPRLALLSTRGLKITDRGFAHLRNTPKLVCFSVSFAKGITDQSSKTFELLFKHCPDPGNAVYRIDHTSITPASVPDLKKLKGIRILDVSGLKGFNTAVVNDLQRALPGSNVEHADTYNKHLQEFDRQSRFKMD